jgi:ABC-type glutathione transport system ATPase component
MATFKFSVPAIEGEPLNVTLESGETVVMVGANGSGKTRLATYLESSVGLTGHRIAAHRALALNPDVPKISEQSALNGLRTGWPDARTSQAHRDGYRWQNKTATLLLNDYDFLVQALYAEQSNTALQTHAAARQGTLRAEVSATKLETLKEVWERLLPGRRLLLSADSIQVQPANGDQYSAADMSDGERAVFYMLGQALVAAVNSVLIVDEPELHVHPSIMGKLWDAIQAERPDCAFIFITHDLAFASARPGKKYVVREYRLTNKQWSIEAVPEDTGFSEELAK